MNQPFIDITAISIVKENAQRLIKSIDHQTSENQDQEELMGYMRRLIIELERADEGGMYNFEPCELKPKTQTMGVMCMIQEFEEIRDTLRNKSVLTLGEILLIRKKYDIYVLSIFIPFVRINTLCTKRFKGKSKPTYSCKQIYKCISF